MMTKKGKGSKQNNIELKAKKSILEYFDKQRKFKNLQAKFEEAKRQFNNEMEAYFQELGIKSMRVESIENDELFGGTLAVAKDLLVTRIQKSSVLFNADKLEFALGKELASQVIHKHYEIVDVAGLIAYLKMCGVDPRIFKSFLMITKSVDTKELDRLEEIGKITLDQVKDCYTVKNAQPYFVVKSEKGNGEGN